MAIFTTSELYNEQLVPRGRQLFSEYNSEAPLHFFKGDKEGKISLYKLFMSFSVEDPSEVQFAEAVFGDIGYWLRIRDEAWIKVHIEEWRKIAAVKRKELAFKAIMAEVKDGGRSSFTAAKYLIEESWNNGTSVAEKKRLRKESLETTEEAFNNSAISNDIKRLKEEGILQ